MHVIAINTVVWHQNQVFDASGCKSGGYGFKFDIIVYKTLVVMKRVKVDVLISQRTYAMLIGLVHFGIWIKLSWYCRQ